MSKAFWSGLVITGLLLLEGMTLHSALGVQDKPKMLDKLPELRLTLREAMQAAIDENPTVQIFLEQVNESRAVAFTELGAMLPHLSGQATMGSRKFFLGNFGGTPRTSDITDFYGTRAFLTQNFFSLSLIQRWQASRFGIEVATLDLETSKRDTMATVALIYLEAISFEAAVKAREADVKLNKELLRLAQERKSAGMATSLDVTRAKVQLENEKQRLLVARTNMERAKLNLLRAIGIPFGVTVVLTDELKRVEVPSQTLEEAMAVAMEERVELKAQQRRERLAAMSLSSVKSERIPSLAGRGDVGMVGNQIPDALTTHNLELTLSIPIFDGGQREGRISESRSRVLQEAIRTRDLNLQIALEVRDALLTLDSAQQEVLVTEEGLRQSLKELDLARERFAVGVATNIEVTNAQASVAGARDNAIRALFNLNAARVNMARAQGRLQDI